MEGDEKRPLGIQDYEWVQVNSSNLPRDSLACDILHQDGGFLVQGALCCRWSYH
jgi:hypothetical protein